MSEHAQSTKSRVLVLFGGQSGEHGISCATAAGVLGAIDRSRYDVLPVGITKDGTWVRMPDDPDRYVLSGDQTYEVQADDAHVVVAPGLADILEVTQADGQQVTAADLGAVDVVFPLLHGPYGEDGTIQGLLEMAGLPYVGCGVLASAAGMDKHVTKVLLSAAGLPAGRWSLVTDRAWREDREGVLAGLADLGLPVFVKPCRAGSSLGITKVDRSEDLPAAIEEARRHDPRVIVESLLTGLEVECAVLGGRGGSAPRCAQPGLIAVSEDVEFYDYQTKYVDHDAVALQIPAPIPDDLAAEVKRVAAATFDALECEGLARVDFFVDPEAGTVVVNEVNTMPGFTPYSMYPALWANEGIAYTDLVTELIELAKERPLGLR
ncbi:MAG: D-alanine--D-alanine ligase family protein [Actinomycetaceae bacterium]|nr:D-alanine--D-alanine ligase family protein [Actinomycetaceae bacterium]MDU0970278.1 D-alanine--D-alanine ligase family protein [Actinomycetaceae bacterium]